MSEGKLIVMQVTVSAQYHELAHQYWESGEVVPKDIFGYEGKIKNVSTFLSKDKEENKTTITFQC